MKRCMQLFGQRTGDLQTGIEQNVPRSPLKFIELHTVRLGDPSVLCLWEIPQNYGLYYMQFLTYCCCPYLAVSNEDISRHTGSITTEGVQWAKLPATGSSDSPYVTA